jgi:hypothetical protein
MVDSGMPGRADVYGVVCFWGSKLLEGRSPIIAQLWLKETAHGGGCGSRSPRTGRD